MIVLETKEDILQFIADAIDLYKKTYKEDNNKFVIEEQLMTREETAALLKITKPTLSKYTKAGIVKGKMVGNRILYRKEDVISCSVSMRSIKYRVR